MKFALYNIFVLYLFCSCNTDESIKLNDYNSEIPVVHTLPTFEVTVTKNIIYAQGLSHTSINSASSTSIPLKLDVYQPNNNATNRPVYMFIHGGGFIGGSKQATNIIALANYYSSRGWVFVAIDYRLKDDFGTLPQEWFDFAENIPSTQVAQYLALYPAQRDAKAALRWIVANSNTYNINTNYITVGGSSAGAITAITAGISSQDDFKNELSTIQDSSLESTNPQETYTVKTIIDYWGSKVALDALEEVYGCQRFSSNMPPLFIAHGTEDTVVPFNSAEQLKTIYDANGVTTAYYPLEGEIHGPWGITVNNKKLDELSFEFIVAQQNLIVQ